MAIPDPVGKSREKIAGLLKRVNRRLNILLLGESDVGKSAFVESVAASLSGEWNHYSATNIEGLKLYPRCCNIRSDVFDDVTLPTLMDTPGLCNDNDGYVTEVLKLLLVGRIPEQESFRNVLAMSRIEGVEELRHKYSTVDKSMEVDVILFLASANIGTFPEKLIQCVVDVAKGIHVYGVLTKSDKLPLGSDLFQVREEEFRQLLCPESASSQFFMRCSNYCKEVSPNRRERNDQTIDSSFLTCFEHIIAPFATREGEIRLTPMQQRLQLKREVGDKRQQLADTLRDAKEPVHVAIFGTPGTGKSALVNSLAAAISDVWREVAISGVQAGTGTAQTFFSKSFPNCGVLNQTSIATYNFLPTIVDYPGFTVPGEDEMNWYGELIKIILYGRMPEGEILERAIDIGKNRGRDGLRRSYPKAVASRKISRVIIMATAKEELPERLFKCVMEAARPTAASSHRRSIPVFGVLTKSDMVNEERQEFKDKEDKFRRTIIGSDDRYFKIVNYCRDSAPKRSEENSPELDLPLLTFLNSLANPNLAVDNDGEVDDYTLFENFDSLARNGVDFALNGMKIWMPLIAAAIPHLLVTINSDKKYRKVDAKTLNMVCMKFNDSSKEIKAELSNMTDICGGEQSTTATTDFYLQFAWLFLFVMVSLLLQVLLKKKS